MIKLEKEYQIRINRVFKYIDENLETDLSLQTISKIALFSPYHFHRIFKFITKETINQYITRKRVEKSAADLIHKNVAIIDLANKYGFNDNSSFTRTFKKYYGVSPTSFKKQNPHKFSKIRQIKSKNGQEYPDHEEYICTLNNLKKWVDMNAKIEIEEMPKIDLAYVPVLGIQNIESAYQKIMTWAAPKGMMNDQTKMITIYHDSFKTTEAHQVRMSACILLNEAVEVVKEIELTSIKEGKCIVGRFEIVLQEFEKSWTSLFIWMNENGYIKSDKDPFEIYHNNFNEHPEKKAIVDFCIPIK